MARNKQEKSPMKKYTLQDLYNQFPDEDSALDWLRHKLYPQRIYCPNCEEPTKHHRIKTRKVYGCDYCGHQISPTAGTIFHKSRTPLRIWLYVIFQLSQTRGGISAKQIERETGVTYKTAWRMCTEIRKRLDENKSPFSGEVEADETYVGGKKKGGKRGRGSENKTAVLGIVERKGRVHTEVIPDAKKATLQPIVEETVKAGSIVYTDEWQSYNGLTEAGYNHHKILHSHEIYVMGNIHTQTIEGFWGNFKNGIRGVQHHVSKDYLQSYLNEHAFRYNHRNDVTPMFTSMLNKVVTT